MNDPQEFGFSAHTDNQPLEFKKFVWSERNLGKLMMLEGFPRGNPPVGTVVAQVRQAIRDADFKIAIQTLELLENSEGKTKPRHRVVGVLWGQVMRLRRVFEIKEALSDPLYTGPVEGLMLDALRVEMLKKGWKQLVVRAPLLKPDSHLVNFAERHAFRGRVRGSALVWQWPPEEEGVE